jgi:biotin operon repressor
MSSDRAGASAPPRPRIWTQEEEARLVALCCGGRTTQQIASELERSAGSVTQRIDHLRRSGSSIPHRHRARHAQNDARIRALWQQGGTTKDISDALGLSPRVVRARITALRASDASIRGLRPCRRWTAEEDARLASLWHDDASAAQIASALGRTVQAIFARVDTLRGRGVRLALRPVTRDPQEDERLIELWGGPEAAVKIGAELGISHASIHRRIAALRAAGVEVPDRRWSPERERRLRSIAHLPLVEIGRELGVSPREARDRLTAMGFIGRPDEPRVEWSPEDDARVSALWLEGETIRCIAQRVGRTTAAVNLRLNHLRRSGHDVPNRVTCRSWTKAEEHRLCKLWLEGATLAGIGHALSRSVASVAGKVNTLRAQGVDLPRRLNRAPGTFTPAQIAQIQNTWRASTMDEIAEAVGCSARTVETRVRALRRRGHRGFPARAPRPREGRRAVLRAPG